MKIKRNSLVKGLYCEPLVERNPVIDANNAIRITFESGLLVWTINHSSYQAVVCVTLDPNDFIDEWTKFDLAVNAQKFFATIKAMVDDVVDFHLTDTTLTISDSKTKVRFPLVDVSQLQENFDANYPDAGESTDDTLVGIDKLPYFTLKDDNGVWASVILNQENGHTEMLASDRGATIYKIVNPCSPDARKVNTLLPPDVVSAIGKLNIIGNPESPTFFTADEHHFELHWGIYQSSDTAPATFNGLRGYLYCRVMSGNVPNLSRIFDHLPEHTFDVNIKAFINAVSFYSQIVDIGSIMLTANGENLSIDDINIEKAVDIENFTSEEAITVTVDVKKLLAVLNRLASETATVHLNKDGTYIVFKSGTTETAVLAKVRRF